MPGREKLAEFVAWRQTHIASDVTFRSGHAAQNLIHPLPFLAEILSHCLKSFGEYDSHQTQMAKRNAQKKTTSNDSGLSFENQIRAADNLEPPG